jgi:hypothetical protein
MMEISNSMMGGALNTADLAHHQTASSLDYKEWDAYDV